MTRDDLIDRFGAFEIERLEKNINDPDATDKAIADASELINSYVASRYRLPLPSIPASVSRAVAAVARYYLYKDKPTESVRTDYEDILKWLSDVATGKVKLKFGAGLDDDNQEPTAFFRSGALVV